MSYWIKSLSIVRSSGLKSNFGYRFVLVLAFCAFVWICELWSDVYDCYMDIYVGAYLRTILPSLVSFFQTFL